MSKLAKVTMCSIHPCPALAILHFPTFKIQLFTRSWESRITAKVIVFKADPQVPALRNNSCDTTTSLQLMDIHRREAPVFMWRTTNSEAVGDAEGTLT